jgi:hypothetical protein
MSFFLHLKGKELYRGDSILTFKDFVYYFGLKRSFGYRNDCVVLEPFMQMWVRSIFLVLFFAGIVMLSFTGAFGSEKGSFKDQLRWYYDFDDKAYEVFTSGAFEYDSNNEVHKGMLESAKEKYKTHNHINSNFIVLLISIIPITIHLFFKQEALVVFDKKRRLIYTVKNSQVYYCRVYDLNYLPFTTNIKAMSHSSVIIPLNVKLFKWGENKCLMKTEVFSTGIFYPDSNCQQQFLCMMLTAYFSNQNLKTNDAWLKSILTGPSKPFLLVLDKLLQFSFRKREDPFSPEVQAVVSDIVDKFKDIEEGDMDFEDFDFSYRKSIKQ